MLDYYDLKLKYLPLAHGLKSWSIAGSAILKAVLPFGSDSGCKGRSLWVGDTMKVIATSGPCLFSSFPGPP